MIASPQFQLVTLGRLVLLDATGTEHELTKRRRKLAVLAYLALADRSVPRETLATIFWPEEDEARARHSLSNALSSLRSALGRSAIELGRFEVALTADAPVEVDIRSVARAAAAQDWPVVLRRATGIFLDGVFVEGSHAFEEWTAGERRRVLRWVEEACRAESPRLLSEGAWTEAAAIGDRWLALAPLSAEAALARLQAELGDGDAESLRRTQLLHERLARRASQEFGEGLDPRVGQWVARQVARPSAPLPLPSANTTTAADTTTAGITTPASAESAGPVPSASPANGTEPVRRRRRVLVGAGLVVAALAAAGVMALRRPAAVERTRWVLVADLDNAARDTLLDRAVPLALGVSLAQSGRTEVVSRDRLLEVLRLMRRPDSLRTVDESTALEAAVRMGADVVLIPTAARTGGSTLLGVRLLDAATGRSLHSSQVQLNGDSTLLAVVDELARRARRALGEREGELRRGVPLPAATTASVAALRAYADGLRFVEAERSQEAIVAFESALLQDSTFVQAHAALGAIYALAGQQEAAEQRFRVALAEANRLPPREAYGVRQTVASGRRDWPAAVTLAQQYLESYPRDREARREFTYALFRAGRRAESAEAYRALLQVDSLDADTWLAYATAIPGDSAGALAAKLQAYARGFQLNKERLTGLIVNQEYGGTLVRAGLPDSAERIFRRMLDLDLSHRARGLRSLGHLGLWRGEFARAAAAFREAAVLERQSGQTVGELRALLGRATAFQALGREAEARPALDSARTMLERSALDLVLHGWVGKALVRVGDRDGAQTIRRLMQERASPARNSDANALLLLDGELAAADGNATLAVRLLDSLWRRDSSAIVLESRAHAVAAAGQSERAAQLFAQLARDPVFGWEGSLGQRTASLFEARARAAVNDASRARVAYAAFLDRFPAADPTWPLLLEARQAVGATPRAQFPARP